MLIQKSMTHFRKRQVSLVLPFCVYESPGEEGAGRLLGQVRAGAQPRTTSCSRESQALHHLAAKNYFR
jgi:hypothetical protein